MMSEKDVFYMRRLGYTGGLIWDDIFDWFESEFGFSTRILQFNTDDYSFDVGGPTGAYHGKSGAKLMDARTLCLRYIIENAFKVRPTKISPEDGRPTRFLCKRTFKVGLPYYWGRGVPARKIKRENRMLVAGVWYDVVYNPNDGENTFTVIDQQDNPHFFMVYSEEDREYWPDHVKGKKYGVGDYAKWFYTPEELELRDKRQSNKVW